MTFRSILTLVASVIVALTPALHEARPSAQAPRAGRPKLIVIIVVDQLRADYLTEYGSSFSAGLHRLLRQGAWFTNAAYPYLNTVTCAGHSTIGTGSLPYRHGMVMNGWLNRETGKTPFCTDDSDVQDISYNGLPPAQGDSAKRMLVPAIGEQVKARGGRVVAMSLKPRSAIPLVGKRADAVIWFDERGGWSTSSAYTQTPVPFLQQFIAANPLSADSGKVWERTLPVSAYRHADDSEGEGLASGWTRTFPHPLGVAGGQPEGQFYSRWQRSPFADEYLQRMAIASVDALQLGRGKATDFLGVSFSSLDVVGHTYGPRSHEVQDLLVRLDRTIGRLLDHLDRTVGAGNYVVGLSADHGVADVPEQIKRGGRQPGKIAQDAVNNALTPLIGPGQHVAATNYTDIYLTHAANAHLRKNPTLVAATMDALRTLPAVERVFRGAELATARARSSGDPVLRAAALSYHPARSGDFVIVPKEHWLLSTSVTTHGTLYSYDQRVPVILFGAAIKPGEYRDAVTPADVTPTLGAIAGVPLARSDGRVLKEALLHH